MGFKFTPNSSEGAEFLGQGFGFPLKVAPGGSVTKAKGLQHVSACVARLQLYNKGDYVGVYSLGGNISGMAFGVNAMNNINSIKKDCENTIENFEDRVSSVRVEFFREKNNPTKLDIASEYTIDRIMVKASDVLEVDDGSISS